MTPRTDQPPSPRRPDEPSKPSQNRREDSAAQDRGPVKGWTVWICAHTHRWQSEDKSTRYPVCGTTTFKEDGYERLCR